jgi:hypothetical protein
MTAQECHHHTGLPHAARVARLFHGGNGKFLVQSLPRQGYHWSVCQWGEDAFMPKKSWSKMTNTEKLDVLRKEIAASTKKFSEIEQRLDEIKSLEIDQRLDEIKGLMMREGSRFSQMVAEVNVRLSSVAANVFEVSAVAARAAELASKPGSSPDAAWPDHRVEHKK